MITLSEHLKSLYGQKIYKLSLSSGCTCPNRDGKISTGGCTFCSEGGSGDFAAPFLPIAEQIRLAREKVDRKIPARIPLGERRYIAYFQSFSNTYDDAARLKELYMETILRQEIIGISIGTRPDCLGPEVLSMLSELNKVKPVWVELGLQTIHEQTAAAINRGYPLSVFEEAYRRLTDLGITVIVHVILGLPGESREDMLETVRYLAGLSPVLSGIKLQLLHVLKGTAMGHAYLKEPFPLFSMDDYTDLVVECLKLLPPQTVIHRMTGDGPKRDLIGPLWSGDKKRVMNTLHKKLAEAKLI